MWCGVVWCGVVWYGVVWCDGCEVPSKGQDCHIGIQVCIAPLASVIRVVMCLPRARLTYWYSTMHCPIGRFVYLAFNLDLAKLGVVGWLVGGGGGQTGARGGHLFAAWRAMHTNTAYPTAVWVNCCPESMGQTMIDEVWHRALPDGSRTLDSHLSRVRTKLALWPHNGVRLTTVYSAGCRLDVVDPI